MKIINLFGKKELAEKELESLYEIEKNSWSNTDLKVSKNILGEWYKLHSQGYWVGEQNNEIVAFIYFIRLSRKDLMLKKRWKDIIENETYKFHKKNGSILFLVTIGSNIFNGENLLIREVLKEVDKGFYEGVRDIYACQKLSILNKKNDLAFSKDPKTNLLKKNKFTVISLEENDDLSDNNFKILNLLVKRKVYGVSRLRLIWRKKWC